MNVVDFNASGNWTPPAGVTSATIECWGGGAAGGGGANSGGNGGGGGEYSKSVVAVSNPTVYAVTVGAGGTGNVDDHSGIPGPAHGDGNPGGDSFFAAGADVYAFGGTGGGSASLGDPNPDPGGTGGIGNVVTHDGGAGAPASAGQTVTGGGGGGAGAAAVGGDANNDTGGTGGAPDGGNGGNGAVTADGSPGNTFGGGGAGAYVDGNVGLSGANGHVRITYLLPPIKNIDGASYQTAFKNFNGGPTISTCLGINGLE